MPLSQTDHVNNTDPWALVTIALSNGLIGVRHQSLANNDL